MEGLTYKVVKLEDITVDDRARKELGAIDDLALSIKDKGLLHPLILDDSLNLLAGERRFRAISMLGWEEVSVFIKELDSPLEALEIELVENLMRKDLTWAEQALLAKKINDAYQKMNKNWSGRDTAELMGRSHGSIADQLQLADAIEAIPEIANMKTADEARKKLSKVHGDIVAEELTKRMLDKEREEIDQPLKRRIERADKSYNVGDVFDGLSGLPKEDPNLSFAEVDPPYAIDLKNKKRSQAWNKEEIEGYLEISSKDYAEFLNKLTKELFRVLSKDATLVFWYGHQWYREVCDALTSAGFLVDEVPSLWIKPQGQTNQEKLKLARAHEPFIYGRKPGAEFGIFKEGRINVFDFSGVYPADKYHPTQRPQDLMTEIIKTFGAHLPPKKKKILVPFLGSGATILAANKLGYDAFGWDNNPDYKGKFLVEMRKDYEKKFLME